MIPDWFAADACYVEQWLEFQLRVCQAPGCVLSIRHDDATVSQSAFGIADLETGERLTPRHRFRVASHSKTFTAVGILTLHEAGLLRLDDRVGTYHAGLTEEVGAVTIAQLLTHSAGLTRDGTDSGHWQNRHPFLDEQDLRAQLSRPLTLGVNTRFKCSNLVFGLLGLAIEAITGEPFDAWIERKVVVNAGLQETTADMPAPCAVYILTGPVMVEEARPGDLLEIEFLHIALRPSRAPGFEGRSFGSNAAVWWGRQYDDLLTAPKPREVVTLYEICICGGRLCAHAAYSYRWTPQRDPSGVLHETIDYPGVPVDPARIEPQHGIMPGVHIPVRPHFGTIGLAPNHPGLLDSIPPSAFGGNIDNWRIGIGAKLFLPVSLPGAMLSLGDPHAAQGDGEVSGTAIECSLTGTLRLRVHARGRPMPCCATSTIR